MKIIVLTAFALALLGQPAAGKKESVQQATGTFEVKLTRDPAGAEWGRMSIEKQFHGDIDGTSRGEMLSAMGSAQGSGAYVAIERVTASVRGRSGTFVLAHHGQMQGGKQELRIDVVPDSGTAELQGLTGTLQIRIEGGKHFYDFAYSLP